jgi:CrcB protein
VGAATLTPAASTLKVMSVDPDLGFPTRPHPAPVYAAISAGGVIGALARYGLSSAWPHPAGGFPWATWTINVSGCFLIGVLMSVIARFHPSQRLIRPFFGVGILGGYTTFSTSIVDVQQVAGHGAPGVAFAYLGATVAGSVLAVWVGSLAVRTK